MYITQGYVDHDTISGVTTTYLSTYDGARTEKYKVTRNAGTNPGYSVEMWTDIGWQNVMTFHDRPDAADGPSSEEEAVQITHDFLIRRDPTK